MKNDYSPEKHHKTYEELLDTKRTTFRSYTKMVGYVRRSMIAVCELDDPDRLALYERIEDLLVNYYYGAPDGPA
jgi:hypothetical protein